MAVVEILLQANGNVEEKLAYVSGNVVMMVHSIERKKC